MHKLILSIIAVAFLQIGFITYIASDKPADNAAIYKAPTFYQAAIPAVQDNVIEVASLNEDPFFKRENGIYRNAATTRFTRAEYSVRRKSIRTSRKSQVQSTSFVPEDVIITYAVQKPYKFTEREPYRNVSVYNEPVVDKSEVVEQPLTKADRSDGNPILNVIKKPYGWIKALGSKLK